MESGFEVLFSSVQNDLLSKDDAVVSAIHWCLVTGGLKCIGKGENLPKNIEKAKKSELLPKEWNGDPGVYCLLYQDSNGDVFLLKVIAMDGTLLIHLMRFKDDKVGDTSVATSDYCTDNLSSYEDAFRNLQGLQKKIQSEVLGPFTKTSAAEASSSSSDKRTGAESSSSRGKGRRSPDGREEEDDPLRVSRPGHAHRSPALRDPEGPFAVGRGDLDPLAGPMAGGMLMDPRRGEFPGAGFPDGGLGMPGRLPRGSVPPGARFDPIGPPDLDGSGAPRGSFRAGPDRDHMRPPGFEDDMFM